MTKVWIARYVDNESIEVWLDDRPDDAELRAIVIDGGLQPCATRDLAIKQVKEWAREEYMAERGEPGELELYWLNKLATDGSADRFMVSRRVSPKQLEPLGWGSVQEMEIRND
jgi:hypothetical protein